MSMRVDGLHSQYSGYKVNVDRVKQEIEKTKNSNIRLCDQAEISAEGKKALESRISHQLLFTIKAANSLMRNCL